MASHAIRLMCSRDVSSNKWRNERVLVCSGDEVSRLSTSRELLAARALVKTMPAPKSAAKIVSNFCTKNTWVRIQKTPSVPVSPSNLMSNAMPVSIIRKCRNASISSLSDLGRIYCGGGDSAHFSAMFRCMEPPCASKSQ